MAGIGFKIEKILKEDSFLSVVKAHIYSSFISSGPWILSIITIFCLNYFSPCNIDSFEMAYFKTSIIYIFALSLIVTGAFYLSLSRYMSDKLYKKDEEALIPIFNSASILLLSIQSVLGWFIFYRSSLNFYSGTLSVMIYLAVSMLWLIMLFLSTLKDYKIITIFYFIGTVITIFSAYPLGEKFGLNGYFASYFLGQFFIVVLLAGRIFIEFKSEEIIDKELLKCLINKKTLVLTGIFYNLAVWIDKIIFWVSAKSIHISGILRFSPEYDSAVFLAYITLLPSFSIFLMHVETSFYRSYKRFYDKVLGKAVYRDIQLAKSGIAHSLRESVNSLLASQGVITLLFITFAPSIAELLKLKSVSIPIFRITTLGAFAHSLLLSLIIIILYFDFQKLALGVTILFLATNALFTFISASFDVPYFGYGYFFSTVITLITAFYMFDFKLNRLEYLTFTSQPLGAQREEQA
ncbi:transmembrane protein [Candidatus Omnitrophus magneticus]|uniref:Transmembrane protein n=1 Tax=Candidatus Omnitrophus magneticus TaxID=1609969 RepID=A0A0F0CQS7_9BACT|nr:transmembrane protein [Candidatus Omnitrophus magneticus]